MMYQEEPVEKQNYFNTSKMYDEYPSPDFQKKEKEPYTLKHTYEFNQEGREQSVYFIFEKDNDVPVHQIARDATTSEAMIDAYDFIAQNLANKYPDEFDLKTYQKMYYSSDLINENLHYNTPPEILAEKLNQNLEFYDPLMATMPFEKTSIQELESVVDFSLDETLKESQAAFKEIKEITNEQVAQTIDKLCKNEDPNITKLLDTIGYKNDIKSQTLLEKYELKNSLYKKKEAAYNKLKKPNKLNVVGSLVYYIKEKILKAEARALEKEYQQYCLSDKIYQEKRSNLEAAIHEYAEAKYELGILGAIKDKIEENDNKQVYLEGKAKNKADVMERAIYFDIELEFFSKNKTATNPRTNEIYLVNPSKKHFQIINPGKTFPLLNEPYYQFDPIDRMNKVEISYQKGEELYTLKKGYCYIVDPEERRRGGDDATRDYVAVIDKNGKIAADFIAERSYDGTEKAILEGKLALAELLRDYDLQQSTDLPNKLDIVEFDNTILQADFDVKENYLECLDMVEDTFDRMFSRTITIEPKKEIEQINHFDKAIDYIKEIQKFNHKGTPAEVEYCNQIKLSNIKSQSVDTLASEDEKIMRKMLCSGKFTTSQIGDAFEKCSPVEYRKERNVVKLMKKISEDPACKKQLCLNGHKM